MRGLGLVRVIAAVGHGAKPTDAAGGMNRRPSVGPPPGPPRAAPQILGTPALPEPTPLRPEKTDDEGKAA